MVKRITETTVTAATGVAALAAAIGVAALIAATPAKAQDQVVYINSSGGVLDDINRKIHWDPFTQATGIKVVASAPVDDAKLKAMVTSGNVEWDITEIDDGDFLRAAKAGLLAKLDLSKLPTSELPTDAVTDYGVWDGPYTTILTWNTTVFPLSGKHPTTLMDLWNQKDFPGPRCLWKDAFDNLELGAMHAGVPRDKVYPINQDTAYKELDKLKKDVGVWWTTGAQSVQAIVNRDCVMGTAWNGRPYQLIVKDKAPLGIAWDDAILRTSWWAIPKGAKHFDNAMKLLAWMQDAHRQAAQATLSGYAGGNKGTAALLPENVQQYLATSPAHLATTVVSDDTWWGTNGPAAEKRFTGWVIAQ
jgi:putative spermidine/putrescine transport system substrate-binding protein